MYNEDDEIYGDEDDVPLDNEDDEREIACPDCGRMIYEDVDVCPYCGYFILDSDRTYPSLLNASWFRWLGLLGIIAVVFVLTVMQVF
ncbi:hypothetical protein Pla110_05860 [Polystyrenella longa]|uniref:Zinc-ribbon domain-containing protein n=1 Tax=Polystyrenella longa TaxID=2528007 RepID=A0A518CI29_9PLAN|nr:hypothetical protein [Polystyrenella longa]QDU78882.1 hypothetical protein Pla110_05860 [Polystyrenella longa]